MTQERDDYMRRQEADHDLLRMRTERPTPRFVCRNADEFITQGRHWLRFTERDLRMAANDIILAMDGKMARVDALMCARAAFESKGMEHSA